MGASASTEEPRSSPPLAAHLQALFTAAEAHAAFASLPATMDTLLQPALHAALGGGPGTRRLSRALARPTGVFQQGGDDTPWERWVGGLAAVCKQPARVARAEVLVAAAIAAAVEEAGEAEATTGSNPSTRGEDPEGVWVGVLSHIKHVCGALEVDLLTMSAAPPRDPMLRALAAALLLELRASEASEVRSRSGGDAGQGFARRGLVVWLKPWGWVGSRAVQSSAAAAWLCRTLPRAADALTLLLRGHFLTSTAAAAVSSLPGLGEAKSSRATLRARWVTLRARWVTLRARWVTLRAGWVTLRAR
jgi:hypothetical protein